MSNQLKKKNSAGGGLYIALAICILSIICIGVYSAVINILDLTPASEISRQEEKQDSGRAPSVVIEPNTTKKPSSVPKSSSPSASAGTENKGENNVSVQAQPTPPSYSLPVEGNVTKPFSNDVLVYSATMNDYRVHNGVDIAAAVGSPIKAFADGTVEAVYEDPLLGFTVVLDHGNGLKSRYSNLNSALPEGIKTGKTVKEGDEIGCLGENILIECVDEPHLHFEVVANGEYEDPMGYFQ